MALARTPPAEAQRLGLSKGPRSAQEDRGYVSRHLLARPSGSMSQGIGTLAWYKLSERVSSNRT
eukprot:3295848-Amphidinium_carterae.1